MYRLAAVLRSEADAILSVYDGVVKAYPTAIALLSTRTPIFSGMGKSGHIAQKAASTFRSLGIPAHYVHPGDASHGDLGAIHGDAVLVLLSNSGNTPELTDMILFCGQTKVPIIAITGVAPNPLTEAAQVALCYGKVKEACHMGLAPTASTAAALALCDALVIDTAEAMGVTPETFRTYHPGGKLGARLRKVTEVMKSPVPIVTDRASVTETAIAMTGEISGVALVRGRKDIIGVVTDGDLRRARSERKFTQTAGDLCNRKPLTVPPHIRAFEAAEIMNHNRVTKLLVKDRAGAIIGVVNLHDCQ